MAKREILAGSTNQTIDVVIEDVNGSPLTGLAYNSSGLTCYYREGATGTSTQLTLATQTVGGAHSDGGFVEIDATNMPGLYRLDLSDTMVSDAGITLIVLNGYAGMAPCRVEIEVVAVDKYNATNFGLSLVPTNVIQISGDSAAADNLEAAADGTGYNLGGGSVVAASVTGAVGSVTGNVGGNVTGSVGSVAAGGITAASIATDAIDADALAADAVTEIVNAIIAIDVDGQDLQEALKIALAILAGKSSGLTDGYGTAVFRDIADTKNRATIAISSDGNRTASTLDGT